MLCIPAAVGVFAIVDAARAAGPIPLKAAGVASAVVVLIGTAYSVNEVRKEVSYGDFPHYGKSPPQVNGVGEYSKWILDWLEKNTDDSGRVLFEVSLGRLHDGSRMAGYYAYTSQREFIGGPYPFQHFATFWDGTAFHKRLGGLPPSEFAKYARSPTTAR